MPDASVSLGLEIKQLQKDLQNAEQMFRSSTTRMARNGEVKLSGGNGLFKNDRRVERGLEGVPAQLAAVQNGYEAAGVAAETASRIMRLPLGIGVGISALILTLGKARDKWIEMQKANQEARVEILKPFAGGSISDLKAQLTSADDQIKKLQSNISFTSVAADLYKNVGTKGLDVAKRGIFGKTSGPNTPEVDANLQNQVDLVNKKFAISAEIARASREEAAANKIMANEDAARGELLKNELATKEKISSIDADENLAPDAKHALKKQAKSDGAIAEDEITKKYYLQQAALIELAYLADLRGSKESQVRAALAAQLADAQKLEQLAKTTQQHEEARTKTAIARKAIYENDVANALRVFQRSAGGANSRIDRANAASDVNATPEDRERNALRAAIAKAQNDSTAARKAHLLQPGDKDAALASTEAHNNELAARSRLAQFERDTAFNNKLELNSAKATTAEMKLQAAGLEVLAKKTKIIADYNERITKARREGKGDVADQLEQQKTTALNSVSADEFLKTPQAKYQQYLQQLDKERATRTIQAQQKDAADRKARGAYNDSSAAQQVKDGIQGSTEDDVSGAASDLSDAASALNDAASALQDALVNQ